MNNTALYDEQADREKLRIAALQPLAVSNCENNNIDYITLNLFCSVSVSIIFL
jgi:hypothetical protein